MKKKRFVSIVLAMIMSLSLSVSAFADVPEKPKNISVEVNGEKVNFPDCQPYSNSDDRTMIPVRFVSEKFGAKVDWDDPNLTAVVSYNAHTVRVPIGKNTLDVTDADGTHRTVKMDTTAVLHNGRTCVPIRFVMESLGVWVGYSDMFNVCQIYSDVLTPEEIDRLHSYKDLTYVEDRQKKGLSSYTVVPWEDTYPECKQFVGEYGFNNANEFKLNYPNDYQAAKYNRAPKCYKSKYSDKTFTFGKQLNIDFSKLILDAACGGIESISKEGKINISLRTDLSCVYSSKHSNEAGTYVRGILDVKIPQNADINEISKECSFIKNPVAGQSYSIDAELYVNTFTSTIFLDGIEDLKA